jgi:mannose-6-phosphate isomerase-like protein (cupin superfamily)
MTAYQLDKTPIHIGPGTAATPVDGFEFTGAGFGAYIEAHCTPDEPGRLAMVEHSPERWGAWECHTEGDEVVILLTGKAEFIQEIDGEERRTVVSPGEAVINPKGVWHSADVIEPFSAVYLTPCPGTKHRPRS